MRHVSTSSLQLNNDLALWAYISILYILTPKGLTHHCTLTLMYFMLYLMRHCIITRKGMVGHVRPLLPLPSIYFIVISLYYVSNVKGVSHIILGALVVSRGCDICYESIMGVSRLA